jgi:hypothetical protein
MDPGPGGQRSRASIATRATHPGGREQPINGAVVTPLTGEVDEWTIGDVRQPNLWLLPATDRDYGEIDVIVQ